MVISAGVSGTTKFMLHEVRFQEWVGSAQAQAKGARNALCRSEMYDAYTTVRTHRSLLNRRVRSSAL